MYRLHTLKIIRKDLRKLSKQAAARIVDFYLPQLIIAVGPREKFYERLLQRLR